jgi:Chlorophyll A-B binding protein
MANIAKPQPSVQPKLVVTRFGFNRFAEQLNGRAAMMGFAALLIIEYVTGQNPLAWMGLGIN